MTIAPFYDKIAGKGAKSMEKLRFAENKDIPVLKKIWQDIFGDSENFVNWFFENCFSPELTYVCEFSGKIVSCLFGYPKKIYINNEIYNALSICGVCTLPEFRGRGLVRKLFENYHKFMKNKEYAFTVLTATKPEIYKKLGYEFITDCYLVKGEGKKSDIVKEISVAENTQALKICYKKFAVKYNGCVDRTEVFEVKMEEFIQSGLKCKVLYKGDEISAYAIYRIADNKAFCEEVVGENTEQLLSNIGMKYECKLPIDTTMDNIYSNYKEDAMGYILRNDMLYKASIGCENITLSSFMRYKGKNKKPCFYIDLY